MAWGAAIAGIASLASGALSYAGTQSTNSANVALGKMQMDFQRQQMAAQADYNIDMWNRQSQLNYDMYAQSYDAQWAQFRESRDFQEHMFDRAMDYNTTMANSAYQRATADMRAAGINPLLAYTQGGASSPVMSGGSAPSGHPVTGSAPGANGVTPGQGARIEARNAISEALTSAFTASRAIQGIEQMASQIENTRADTTVKEAAAENVRAQTALNTAQAVTEAERPAAVRAEITRTLRHSNLLLEQRETERLRPGLLAAQTNSANASATNTQLENQAFRQFGRPGVFGNAGSTADALGRSIGNGLRDLYNDLIR